MDDVDLPLVAPDEAGIDEGIDGGRQLVRHVVDVQTPAHPVALVGDVDEPHHHLADRLGVAAVLNGPFAETFDGCGDAADLDVARPP